MYTDEELFSHYQKYENLKLTAKALDMKWQTLYWRLKNAGYAVVGNKKKYGSMTDKLAVHSEEFFQQLVPSAQNLNYSKFQSQLDFKVGELAIDVKSSTKKVQNSHRSTPSESLRWAFGITEKQQECDFLVCFCYSGLDAENHGEICKILLIPNEFFRNYQTISVSCNSSKWDDFSIEAEELREFFNNFS